MSSFFRALRNSHTKRLYSTSSSFVQASVRQYDAVNRPHGFNANEPAIFKNSFRDKLPAIEKWFTPTSTDKSRHELKNPYFDPFGDSIVPLEATQVSENGQTSFDQIQAPLYVLIAHMNSADPSGTHLYLAQHPLDELPPALQANLPTPSLLSDLGRGDIYGSSIWMGKPPTRTPLHRDPNPNLFVQLAGQKVVRLLRPDLGRAVYERVRAQVGRASGTANMRGMEMMMGNEMELLEAAIWDDGNEFNEEEGVEARLGSGDGLYIPLGWWHAVRSVGSGANASVNWWFR